MLVCKILINAGMVIPMVGTARKTNNDAICLCTHGGGICGGHFANSVFKTTSSPDRESSESQALFG